MGPWASNSWYKWLSSAEGCRPDMYRFVFLVLADFGRA